MGTERQFGARIKSHCWTHRVLWRSDKVTFEVQMKRHRIDEKAEKMVVPRGSSPQLYEIRLYENQR